MKLRLMIQYKSLSINWNHSSFVCPLLNFDRKPDFILIGFSVSTLLYTVSSVFLFIWIESLLFEWYSITFTISFFNSLIIFNEGSFSEEFKSFGLILLFLLKIGILFSNRSLSSFSKFKICLLIELFLPYASRIFSILLS